MNFKVRTEDLQDLVIALIELRPDKVVTQEDKDRLIDVLGEMNRMCNEENNYTLSITVS